MIRWGRVVGLLLGFWLLIELGAQSFVYGWVGRPFDTFAKYRLSAYGLVRNNPRLTLPGFEHNKHGLRNKQDYGPEKPPRTLRVLVLGGSVAYSGLATETLADAERPDTDSVINRYLEDLLRADPALEGINVEVLNASIPFNRAYEVSAAYIAEYAAYDSDIVIVMGSGNNFIGPAPYDRELRTHNYGAWGQHPWTQDFDRIANRRALLTVTEHAFLYLEDVSASAALLRKVSSKGLDNAIRARNRYAARFTPAPKADEVASFDQYDVYINDVLGVAEAMSAVAKRHDQEIVFFWEYFIRHLGGIRRFPPAELPLYEALRRPTDERDASYNFHARDKFAAWCRENQVTFLDPIDLLREDQTPIFIDYLHYTPEGNRVFAQFMYEQMKDTFHERARRIREQ